jgi:hypothetical protein
MHRIADAWLEGSGEHTAREQFPREETHMKIRRLEDSSS